MRELPLADEVLEPLPLTPVPQKPRRQRRAVGESLLLAILLSGWAWAVHAWFRTRQEAKTVAESAPEPVLPVEVEATRVPERFPTATPIPTPVPEPLRLDSLPSGASVLRNGRFVGVTPLLLHDVRSGEVVQLSLAGHDPQSFTLRADDAGGERRIDLPPRRSWIRVRLSPPEARLFVNGTEVELPADGRLLLLEREHVLRAEAPGRQGREVRVIPASAFEREVDLRLDP